jgi:cystathionine beta-lyase/cystathionine gamma-synthase
MTILYCSNLAMMTHASIPDSKRLELGISDNMIRVSVGIEDDRDLIFDLDQALLIAYDELLTR